MAAFTQDVEKINAPSFLGYAKEISQPQGDKGLGIALEGIGKAFQDFVTIRDTQNKRAIDEAVDSGTENLQGQMIATLEDAAGVPEDQRVAKGYTPDPQLLPKKAGDLSVPDDVSTDTESAVGSMGNLAEAKAGRPVPLYYDARMDMLRKDLRSRYPGYKDYIDSKMGNTGNKYISDLMRQIAASQSSLASEQNKLYNLVEPEAKRGNPDAARIIQGIATGKIDRVGVTAWLSNANRAKWDIEDINNEVARMEGDEKLQKRAAMDALPKVASSVMNETKVNLFDNKVGSLKDVMEVLDDLATGKKAPLSEVDANRLGAMLDAYRRQVYSKIEDKYNQPINGKRSIAQILGQPDDIKKQINASLGELDQVIDAVKNKEYGLASESARTIQAMTNDATRAIFTDKEVGDTYLSLSVLNKAAGPNGIANISLRDMLATPGLMAKTAARTKQLISGIASQTGGYTTLSDAFKKLKADGTGVIKENDPAPDVTVQQRGAYNKVLKVNDILNDPKVNDEVKANIAKGSYGPGNEDLLDQIDKDYTDKNGNVVSGRNQVYKDMTTESKANAMKQLGQSDPRQWANYVVWTEGGFRKLFGENVRDLDSVIGSAAKMNDSRLNFTYSMTEHKFVLTNTRERSKLFAKSYDIHEAEMQRLVSQVNDGLQSLANVAKAAGSDPNAYILRQMAASNIKPEGIGGLMAKALITAGTKPKEEGTSK